MAKTSNQHLADEIMWMLKDIPGDTPILKIHHLMEFLRGTKTKDQIFNELKLLK